MPLLSSRLARTFLAAGFLIAAAQAQHAPTIRVGVTAGPHAEIIDVGKKVAAEHSLTIKVVAFTDYVFPNQALANKDLDANSSSTSRT